MQNDQKNSVVQNVVNIFTEKFAKWVVGVLVALVALLYNNMSTKVENLEKNVTILYQDKVSRAEFREEIANLRTQNDANKSDILARIDLYFKYVTPFITDKKDK